MKFLLETLLRNPYPLYSAMRRFAPVFHDRRHDLWMLFDYESVRASMSDPQTFSSRAASPGGEPLDWMIFLHPPLRCARIRRCCRPPSRKCCVTVRPSSSCSARPRAS